MNQIHSLSVKHTFYKPTVKHTVYQSNTKSIKHKVYQWNTQSISQTQSLSVYQSNTKYISLSQYQSNTKSISQTQSLSVKHNSLSLVSVYQSHTKVYQSNAKSITSISQTKSINQNTVNHSLSNTGLDCTSLGRTLQCNKPNTWFDYLHKEKIAIWREYKSISWLDYKYSMTVGKGLCWKSQIVTVENAKQLKKGHIYYIDDEAEWEGERSSRVEVGVWVGLGAWVVGLGERGL